MYDKLVQQCQNCVDSLCGECDYKHLLKPGNFVKCMNALITDAANAINNLQKENEQLHSDLGKAIRDLAKKHSEFQKIGKWILHQDGSATCSMCHTRQSDIWDLDNWQNYCGRCGAKMQTVIGDAEWRKLGSE